MHRTVLLHGMKLTTAEIFYHMPDHPALLQTYVWQEYDVSPSFPILRRFLEFWDKTLEGKLHSVKVASCDILRPAEFIYCDSTIKIH
jgi:uncharacterized protein Usg